MTKVCVSGYFDPIHNGHIDYLKAAKKLGDELIVIVNNNNQAKLKKGFYFYEAGIKKNIIEHLKFVDKVVIATDKERTISETLETIKPDIFAKGGDVTKIPDKEQEVCDRLGIKVVYNVGGGKKNSSSKLTENDCRSTVWGRWKVLHCGLGYKVKRIDVDAGRSLSYQRHKYRSEHWVVVKGTATVLTEFGDSKQELKLQKDESIYIPKNTWHKLSNHTSEDLIVIEVATGRNITEKDIERREDVNS